jgi:hypothetical protein
MEEFAFIWLFWLCRNKKVFNDKKFYYARYLPIHLFVLFMVVSSVCGGPRLLYEDVYMVGGHDEEIYFPT